jgi:hypothetical protein
MGVCLVLSVFLSADEAVFAQAPALSGRDAVVIRRLTGLGRSARIKTPQYRTNAISGSGTEKEWVACEVLFDTAPDWIDELTVSYWLITMTGPRQARSVSLFKATVKYGDVAAGRNHLCSVYLRPAAVTRYGEPVAVAVEIRAGEQVLAARAEAESREVALPAGEWWKNPSVVENPRVVAVREGYLLRKDQSPFALVNYDDYEFAK